MRINSERIKKLTKRLSWINNKNGYVFSVAVALLFTSILMAAYFVTMRPPSNDTMSISLLDSQKKASNYPEMLVLNKNNTFNVWVEVENHMGTSERCEVLLKLTNEETQVADATRMLGEAIFR